MYVELTPSISVGKQAVHSMIDTVIPKGSSTSFNRGQDNL